jgi:hypothetical protein
MNKEKREALEAAGFKVGTVEEFLGPKIRWPKIEEAVDKKRQMLCVACDQCHKAVIADKVGYGDTVEAAMDDLERQL